MNLRLPFNWMKREAAADGVTIAAEADAEPILDGARPSA